MNETMKVDKEKFENGIATLQNVLADHFGLKPEQKNDCELAFQKGLVSAMNALGIDYQTMSDGSVRCFAGFLIEE